MVIRNGRLGATLIVMSIAAGSVVGTEPRGRQQTPPSTIRIVVIDGEEAVNVIQKRTAVAPIVEVRDSNDLPVPGAVVTFALFGEKTATFTGGFPTLAVTTNAAGRAVATGLSPLTRGAVQIHVQAAFQGQIATTTITQTNVLTAAQAAALGGSGSSGTSASTSGNTGTAGAGGSGGISGATLGIAGAAVGAGALAATVAAGGAEESAPGTPVGTVVASNTPTGPSPVPGTPPTQSPVPGSPPGSNPTPGTPVAPVEVPFSAVDLRVGSGAEATRGRAVVVSYVGWLYDPNGPDNKGSQFDAGGSFVFTLGSGSVIAGFDMGVTGMRVGGLRRVVVPPALGYGSQPPAPIPVNATLIFEVVLLELR